jgi:hypothetical protein
MGLNKEECVIPSVKTLGYCQYGTEYYEMAGRALENQNALQTDQVFLPVLILVLDTENKSRTERGREGFTSRLV